MPYGSDNPDWKAELDQLYNAIRDAANNCGLLPNRADSLPGLDFVSTIFKRVRSAEAMIAVCSPDPKTCQSNPNVLYELGVAHALGRPALLLTTNSETLPADLRTKHALVYQPSELRTWQDLSNTIKIHLQEILNRTGDTFVDPEWHPHGIRAIKARHKMCLDEAFTHHFAVIVTFTENIRHFFQPIDNELPHLESYVREIYTQIDDIEEDKIALFNESWKRYVGAFEKAAEEIYGASLKRSEVVGPEYLSAVEDAFKFFEEQTATDIVISKAVAKAKSSYNLIKCALDRYPGRHNKIVGEYLTIGQYLATKLGIDITEFYAKIQQLKLDAQQVVLQSHNLMINLLIVFRKG
jgi:hypothetical protein